MAVLGVLINKILGSQGARQDLAVQTVCTFLP